MTMYALKPIVSIPEGDIYKAKSMYEMKNIHDVKVPSNHTSHESKIVSDITEQVIKFLKTPLPEVAELEIRQEKILTQLVELREQVSSLCSILKSSSQNKSASNTARENKKKIHVDLVINANPSKPPLSILALQKFWKDTDIRVTTHVHSNTSASLPNFPTTPVNLTSNNNGIELSLIWKNVIDLEVVVSGVCGVPLLGEVNFLRYLSRLIDSQNYESAVSPIESSIIDGILDICHELSFLNSPKEVNSLLSVLGSKLGSKQWLVGNEPSIADVAAWSVISRLESRKLPGNLANWFTRCDNIF